jgi:hypothetical protein
MVSKSLKISGDVIIPFCEEHYMCTVYVGTAHKVSVLFIQLQDFTENVFMYRKSAQLMQMHSQHFEDSDGFATRSLSLAFSLPHNH